MPNDPAYINNFSTFPVSTIPRPKYDGMTKSSLCCQADFLTKDFEYWCTIINREIICNRKLWEWVYILQSLSQRGMLGEGKKGLGFAVGHEPLPAAFASLGCEILATDIEPDLGATRGWEDGGQLCKGLMDLYDPNICTEEVFRTKVSYTALNMNSIGSEFVDFDFNWSSCAFEHLGSIEMGVSFILNQMNTLKSGGVAVHTTEYNISSNNETLNEEVGVVYRRQDIERIACALRSLGHSVAELDFSLGWFPYDYTIDTPPFCSSPHIRLLLGHFVCTSLGLVITKK